ncbi:MAG: molybdopterin molybdotransferase MoeA [Thermodesulfobacteriota bacterium]|nr:molybdopterin molybdotransferase MoeA [Thermodesulfobacteriota bacterium]
MIHLEEAIRRILEQIPCLGLERLSFQQAQGRVLGEDIPAPRNIPPWDNSAMDGYAVRWRDIRAASPEKPVVLKVLADLPAGRTFKGRLGPGEALRIMTGAPLPRSVDTVVQVESTERSGANVKIFAGPGKGKNIRLAGEDVKTGDLVLAKGTVLQPAHIGMLASFQRSVVYVYQQPRVAILATGDELLEIDEPLKEGKIVNSNSYTITAQVAACGGLPIQLGIAKDRMEDLLSKIQQGLVADLLVTSGGVSVGDYDLVKEMLKKLGKINFWKVAMRPGQPLAFGLISEKPLFGLPGNPVSSMVSFEQFVRPAILKMSGHQNLFRPTLKACLREEIEKKAGLVHFIRCRLSREGEKIYASTTGEQGSGILSSMVKAQGLIVLPRDLTRARAGEEVQTILLDPMFFHSPLPSYLSLPGGRQKKS